MKASFIFPGVGSQYTRMGKNYYDNFGVVRETFAEVSDIVKKDIASLCFNSERETELNILSNAQLCVFTISIAYHRLIKTLLPIEPSFYCGYSLGEYSALCSCGVLTLQESIKLIEMRSKVLQDITNKKLGSMMWVVELDATNTENVCKEMRNLGYHIYISGYNSLKQTAISGDNLAIKKAIERLEDLGALVVPLELSGPYHSILMQEAYDYMKEIVYEFEFHKSTVPIIANWNSLEYKEGEYQKYLLNQLIHPVCWMQTMKKIYETKPDFIIEIGPKEVLTYLSQKNNSNILAISLDKLENLEKVRNYYENNCMMLQ